MIGPDPSSVRNPGKCVFHEMKMLKFLKKCFLVLSLVALASLILVLGINDYIIVENASDIYPLTDARYLDQSSEWIIVLGCSVLPDGEPSAMLRDRMECGVNLYQSGVGKKLLLSGDGEGQYYNEVRTMKQYAMDLGVPEEDIFTDESGLSTYDSLYRAKKIYGVRSAVIVTQEYHLYRSLFDARHLHIRVKGACFSDREFDEQWVRDIREIGARFSDFMKILTSRKVPLSA